MAGVRYSVHVQHCSDIYIIHGGPQKSKPLPNDQ